jgi:hypothetical protein
MEIKQKWLLLLLIAFIPSSKLLKLSRKNIELMGMQKEAYQRMRGGGRFPGPNRYQPNPYGYNDYGYQRRPRYQQNPSGPEQDPFGQPYQNGPGQYNRYRPSYYSVMTTLPPITTVAPFPMNIINSLFG